MNNDLVFILSKQGKNQSYQTKSILDDLKIPNILILDDRDFDKKYQNITKDVPPGAWAIAFTVIKELGYTGNVWFIEDDVQIHKDIFKILFNWTKINNISSFCVPKIFYREIDTDWYWWNDTISNLGSLNQLCYMPSNMVSQIINTKESEFHEWWFVKIAQENNIPIICWREVEEISKLFGPWNWRPVIHPGPGIRHPVKDLTS
jgi:hypothetical protein